MLDSLVGIFLSLIFLSDISLQLRQNAFTEIPAHISAFNISFPPRCAILPSAICHLPFWARSPCHNDPATTPMILPRHSPPPPGVSAKAGLPRRSLDVLAKAGAQSRRASARTK